MGAGCALYEMAIVMNSHTDYSALITVLSNLDKI